jgi:hypothetical protein
MLLMRTILGLSLIVSVAAAQETQKIAITTAGKLLVKKSTDGKTTEVQISFGPTSGKPKTRSIPMPFTLTVEGGAISQADASRTIEVLSLDALKRKLPDFAKVTAQMGAQCNYQKQGTYEYCFNPTCNEIGRVCKLHSDANNHNCSCDPR